MRARRHPAHARTQHRTDRDPGGDGALLPGLRDVGHHVAGAPGCARRPEAGPPADPVVDARAGPAARSSPSQVRERRRSGHGEVPPPRRPGHLRRTRSNGTAVVVAGPPHRRTRELRLAGGRSPGRDAIHGSAAVGDRHGAPAGHGRGDRRLHPELRRLRAGARRAPVAVPEPARQRRRRDRRRHGHEHPAAQPG